MTPNEKGIDVFVSYAHEDRDAVETLVQFLEKRQWSVWWDSHLTGGTAFDTAIEAKLKAARCVIVLWSNASAKSAFVFDEASLAYQREIVVPVLIGIDATRLPLGFRRVQCVTLAARDGYAMLQRAVEAKLQQPSPLPPTPPPPRRRYWLVGAVLALAAIATLLFLRQPSYRARFLALRPGGNLGQSTAPDRMIGVTLWKMRPVADKDPPHTRMLRPVLRDKSEGVTTEGTPVRVTSDAQLPEGSEVRLGIESSRDGYVYVIDRELHRDGTTGSPQLIFPAPLTRGSGTRIVRGCLLELPTLDSASIAWKMESTEKNYAGELLTIVVSSQSIPQLEDTKDPSTLPDSLVSEWERDWGAAAHHVFDGPGGALTTPAEAQARAGCSHLLTSGDVAPTAIYEFPAGGSKSMLVRFPIRVIPKP